MILALRASGRFASCLNGGQQQRDEDSNDRDHDEQLDQRKARRAAHCSGHLSQRISHDLVLLPNSAATIAPSNL
jgi:hypothetical protein